MDEQYERMEAYLKSKKPGFYVPDSACENASVIVFYSYPAAEDVRDGKTVSLWKTWHGVPLSEGERTDANVAIGVMHISNVPLFALDEETGELASEMEYTRSCRYPTSEYLKREFARKMTEIVENECVRLVVYKLEMFLRYYEYFMESTNERTVSRLRSRLADGSLRVIPFPIYTKQQLARYTKMHNDFIAAVNALEK